MDIIIDLGDRIERRRITRPAQEGRVVLLAMRAASEGTRVQGVAWHESDGPVLWVGGWATDLHRELGAVPLERLDVARRLLEAL